MTTLICAAIIPRRIVSRYRQRSLRNHEPCLLRANCVVRVRSFNSLKNNRAQAR